jgi:LysM repeat protein
MTSLRAAEQEHVVRRGETLERIATRYRVRLADLLTANTLTMKSIIHPGQILRIP